MYTIVLKVHLAVVALSILLFICRAGLSFKQSPQANSNVLVLGAKFLMLLILLSAGTLCYITGQYPGADGWLTEKLIALIAYIAVSVIALKPDHSTAVRALLTVLTIVIFLFIGMVAGRHAGFIF